MSINDPSCCIEARASCEVARTGFAAAHDDIVVKKPISQVIPKNYDRWSRKNLVAETWELEF